MKRVLGISLMAFGLALLIASVGLIIYNRVEESDAQKTVETYLPSVIDAINGKDGSSSPESDTNDDAIPDTSVEPSLKEGFSDEMTVVTIDGYDFIGFISLPSLELELPVMANTSKEQLRLSPCRFSGSTYTDDLVIGAHNYQTHFGRLNELKAGDTVYFTDMDGAVSEYSVVFTEILKPDDADELRSGEYSLTLYTCTYGGATRVTVRCEKVN